MASASAWFAQSMALYLGVLVEADKPVMMIRWGLVARGVDGSRLASVNTPSLKSMVVRALDMFLIRKLCDGLRQKRRPRLCWLM